MFLQNDFIWWYMYYDKNLCSFNFKYFNLLFLYRYFYIIRAVISCDSPPPQRKMATSSRINPLALPLQASVDSPIHIGPHMNRREYKPLTKIKKHSLYTQSSLLGTFKFQFEDLKRLPCNFKKKGERYTEKYLVFNQYHLKLKMFKYILLQNIERSLRVRGTYLFYSTTAR